MSKPTSIKEYMAQQSPNYKRGWEDCLRALRFYLEHEGTSKPRLTTYCAAMGDVEHYLFEGVGTDKYPNEDYQNGLEAFFEDMLIDDNVIDLKANSD